MEPKTKLTFWAVVTTATGPLYRLPLLGRWVWWRLQASYLYHQCWLRMRRPWYNGRYWGEQV